MKEKICPFIIGLLLGAILATGGFLIYSKSVNNNQNMPQMSNRMGEPPEKPEGDNGGEPPEKPENQQNSN